MKIRKCITVLLVLLTIKSFGQKKSISVEDIFSRYLVSQDESLAKMIISSNDTIYKVYCEADLEKNSKLKIEYYTKFISFNPKIGLDKAYLNRGLQYMLNNSYDSSIFDFTKSLKLNSDEIYAYYFRASAYNSIKKIDNAISDYTKALEIDKSFYLAYYMRGLCYDTKKQYDNSISDFTQVIKLDKTYDKAFVMRGLAYESLGEFKKAIKDWTEAKKLNAENTENVDSFITRVKAKL